MNKIERIKELAALLSKAAIDYYVYDHPTMTDKKYDELYDELEMLEKETGVILSSSVTQKVQGEVLDCFNKVKHSKPMLSAAKTKDQNDIKKFIGDKDYYCSYKLDGLTLVTIYENGQLKQAITRGTGEVGEDVTAQARMISNLPMAIPYNDNLVLRGECVVSRENFDAVNKKLKEPFSHPRNMAAGSLRNLDANITKQRNLSYVVFECVSDFYNERDGLCNSKWDELAYLDYLGFETVERRIGTVDDCIEEMKPEFYQYPVDGLIFELCDKEYSKSLSATAHHEGCRMALKWKDEVYETKLLDIEWTVGRSSTITPTAVFEPIEIDGTMVEKASVHNVSVLTQLDLHVGDIIEVYKANMIIPQINRNISAENRIDTDYIVIPGTCPVCGGAAKIKETDNSKILVCTNPDCTAKKIAQFTHFASKNCMAIDGLSEATIEKFIEKGFLNTFKDIYHLDEHRNKLIYLDGFGVKSIDKLLSAINKSKEVKLENFIAALGIDGIGLSTAKTISKEFNGEVYKWLGAFFNNFDWTKLDDFGDIMAYNIEEYLQNHVADVESLAEEMNFIIVEESNDNSLEGLKFCITGSFSQSRDGLKKKLESKGAKFVSSVSKNLDILFAGEKAGSKLTKAQQLGIKVVDENELLEMLGE